MGCQTVAKAIVESRRVRASGEVGDVRMRFDRRPTKAGEARNNWPIEGVDGDLVWIEAIGFILQLALSWFM
jgi:hypothetical protein